MTNFFFIHNKCLSFRQLKCGESQMTYLARNTVKEAKLFVRFLPVSATGKLLVIVSVNFIDDWSAQERLRELKLCQ